MGDIPITVNAMKSGAVDFLQKPIKDKDLLRAIEQALERAAGERANNAETADIQRRVETLTAREREVMGLVVTGMLNEQIAYEIGTVEKTIKVHRGRVRDKMRADLLAHLVRLAEKVRISSRTKE